MAVVHKQAKSEKQSEVLNLKWHDKQQEKMQIFRFKGACGGIQVNLKLYFTAEYNMDPCTHTRKLKVSNSPGLQTFYFESKPVMASKS